MVQVFIDLNSKMNIIYLDFAKKLGFWVQQIAINAQKINDFKLNIFGMVLVFFLVKNEKKFYFFKKIFLVTNLSINVALKMFFFILNNIEVNFVN